ncbi:MAG: metal-dependent hydrolase [Hylemonella sp.]|jgi:L-ascorbate metabolism protein UlaG (beta-lactamase superfamily)|nr:metal-dependent hydrolase [Hylemonella sp.]
MQPLFKQLLKAALATSVLLGAISASAQSGKTEVLWLGQASVRITTPGGKVIVVDPWLRTNPKTPASFKNLEALGKVDLVLVTHGHFDHVADAPDLAKMHKVPMYGPAGLNQTLTTLGVLPAELSPRFGKGGTIMPFGPNGVKITATHAEHSSEYAWKNPATTKEEVQVGGEPVGFIIEMENGFKIYHMGDTGLFGDMKFIGEYYKPDLLLIPIGGHFVMSPADAAYAVKNYLKPKYALPIHYGTIPQLKGTTAEFSAALGNESNKMLAVNPGEKVDF